MIQRLYVHNFRCLENFELTLKDMPSVLLIGKNGTGKSTIASVLEILQSIGRGDEIQVGKLVQLKDFARGRSDVPIRFEIEVLLHQKLYKYVLALELPEQFRELRVFEEQLIVDGTSIYSRKEANITFHPSGKNRETQFRLDWHRVALPLIQERSDTDPLRLFKTWLKQMIILSPMPSLMTGDSTVETLDPKRDGSNFAEWLNGLLSRYPAAYTHIEKYLRQVIPDMKDFRNKPTSEESKSLIVRFEEHTANLSVNFKDLSDGEKCFFLCAVVLAANESYGPFFCFWDEPDNYLSLSEAGHSILALRRSFLTPSQILVTSHNSEAIRRFSDENTIVLSRKSHLEPTVTRLLSENPIAGDLIDALICGDIDNGLQ